MREKEKIIYYSDELNDEFAGDNIVAKKIDADYVYLRDGLFGKTAHIFWYRIIAIPLAKLYMKVHFRHKIINKNVLKSVKDTGFFMYGNHTHFLADALVPTMVNMPKTVAVVVHPNNVSMPFLGRITPYLGALPLPDDSEAGKNFLKAVEKRIEQKYCVMIYPEAHIWPFYTDIRPFGEMSFRYPIKQGVPAFCLTNTYQKRRYSKKPKMVTYIDGPFFPDETLSPKEKKKKLRDEIYNAMKNRAKSSNVCMIRYEKSEKLKEKQTKVDL